MKFQFQADDLKDRGMYLGEGSHEVTVTGLESKVSKAGNDMLVVEFSDQHGAKAFEYVTQNTAWKMAAIAKACGFTKEVLASGQFESTMVQGKKLTLVKRATGKEVYEGKERTVYAQDYLQSSGAAASSSDETLPF